MEKRLFIRRGGEYNLPIIEQFIHSTFSAIPCTFKGQRVWQKNMNIEYMYVFCDKLLRNRRDDCYSYSSV